MKYFLPIDQFLNEDETQSDIKRKKRLRYVRYIEDFEDEKLEDSEKYNQEQQIGQRAAEFHNISINVSK